MRVLLINPSVPAAMRVTSIPLGLLSIASYLQREGHEVKIVDRTVYRNSIDKCLNGFAPEIVGIAAISAYSYKDSISLSKRFKAEGLTVVWGGQFCSAMPELCLKEGCVDFIIIGEGEITWSELTAALKNKTDITTVDGLAYIKNGITTYTNIRQFADLSQFPDLDWTLIEPQKYFQTFFGCKRMLYTYAAKGCPGNCSFCYNPGFHRRTQRVRPPQQVVREIKYLTENTQVDGFYFSDEFWYCNKNHITEFCALMKENNISAIWGCNSRVGALSKEEIIMMHSAGCRWLLFGIESGSADRVKEIDKGIDISKAQEYFDLCRTLGISTQSTFITGYPGETTEELKQSVALAKQLNANMCPFNIMYPQPGSDIYRYVQKKYPESLPNTLKGWSKAGYGNKAVVNLSHIPERDMKVVMYYYQWKAFTDKNSIAGDSYGILVKAASDAIKKIFHGGPVEFFKGTAASAKQFVTVLTYAKLFPGIIKKYGLKD